jgi:hypothetical protein
VARKFWYMNPPHGRPRGATDLVRTANQERPPPRPATPAKVRPSIRRIVDAMGDIPAFVAKGRLEILYANPVMEALYPRTFRTPRVR